MAFHGSPMDDTNTIGWLFVFVLLLGPGNPTDLLFLSFTVFSLLFINNGLPQTCVIGYRGLMSY